ncbi:MAG: AI-2E family transporter, partial [Gemmatimonadales bacterium]
AVGIQSLLFLTYFLLAAAPLFRRKLEAVVPEEDTRQRIAHAMREVEGHMSRYLLLTALTCLAVGVATTGWLSVVGMPSAGLWGVVAGVLNLVPYLGAVATLTIIGGAALVSFDGFQQALLAVGGFGVVNLLEGNLLTPMLLGRKLPLNQVAVFVGFLFWGWVWGITGMVLAVPMMVLIKVGCDRVELTRPVAVFLDN